MDNYKRTVELVEIAQNSEGRSSQQFAKYAESLEYKIKQLRNTWEQFRVNVLNSKFFKLLADSANSLLTTITKFDTFDWASALVIFLTVGKRAAKNFIEGWRTGINSVKGKFSLISQGQQGNIPGFASKFLFGKKNVEKINAINSLSPDAKEGYKEDLEIAQKKASASYQAIANAASIAFTTAFSTAMMTNDPGKVLSSTLITGATNAIPIMMSQGFGVGFKTLLVSAAIGAATAGWKALKNYFAEKAEENARKESSFYDAVRALEDLKKKEEEINNTLAERKSLLEDSEKSYKELQKSGEKLEELSKKALLTNEEQEEYLKLSNEIVEQYPELLNYYDSEGNAIVNLGKAYEELIEKKKENYLLDKQQVADSEYELALNKYSQAIETQKKVQNASDEQTRALMSLTGLGSKSNKLISAAYFKEVLKDKSIFNSEKTGEEYIDFLIDILDDNETAQLEFKDALESYNKSIQITTQEIEKARQDLISKAESQVATRLEGTKYYQGITDVNAQKAMQRAVLRNAGYDWDNLQEEFKKSVDTTGMNDTKYQEEFIKFFSEKLKNINLDENELAKIFTKETAAAWHSITLAVGDNATKEQYARAVASSNLSYAEKQSWAQANVNDIQAINAEKMNLASVLGDTLNTIDIGGVLLYQFESKSLGKKIEELGQNGYDKFVKGFESASIGGEDIQKLYLQKIQEISDELGSKNFQVLMSQDWDSYTKANSEQFWNSMTEDFTGIDATKFKNKYKQLIEDIFTNPYISGDNLFDQIDKNFETLETNIQAYGKAIKSSVENGYIDASALKALYKAGAPIDKMVNEDSTINKAEADKWIEEQLASEDQIVELLKDQEEQRINQLESLLGELKLEKEITQQLIYQKALQETNNMASAQALAEQYGGLTKNEIINQLEKEIELRRENLSDEAKLHKIAQGYLKASWGSYNDVNKDYQESLDKTKEKVESSSKAITDAYDNILEKQQDLLDKQKKLNEVLYGTSTRKTSLDLLYNYKTALDSLNREIERAKDILEDLDGQSPAEYLDTIITGTHGRAAYLTAQNEVNQKAIDRTLSSINQQLGSWLINHGYGYINPSSLYNWNSGLGIYEIDTDTLGSERMNDDLKELIEQQVDSLNQLKTNIFENNEAIRKEQKEFLEYQRKVRDNYLSIEDEVVKKLEEYYKQQIDDKKDMYDALSEADNDYLNALEKAINKQKQLRDRQDKWNSLAEKEKKYSLLARDTSGAGQKDLIKLQQDIQKDRTNLLDESVNDVVNELKELYELQKETREDEIKYQESLLENANLVQEANAIMQSWKSIDDLMSWMYEHTEGIENMSDAAIEKLSDDWKTMFDNIQIYNELQQAEVSDMFNFTAEEIQQIVIGTAEALTNESSRAIIEVTQKVEQSITDAQKAVTDAMKALTEAQTKYNTAIAEFNGLVVQYKDAVKRSQEQESEPGLNYKIPEKQYGPLADPSTVVHQNLQLSTMLDQINKEGVYSLGTDPYIRSLDNIDVQKGATTVISQGQARWLFDILSDYGINLVSSAGMTYAITDEKLGNFMTGHRYDAKIIKEAKKYASGGLVNYTGPAWVDGSSARPEAFLNAEDTARIGEAANIFKEIAALGNNGTLSSALSSTSNNNIELHIHVDSIATESQVDYLIDRMKQELVDAASPIGANVIF